MAVKGNVSMLKRRYSTKKVAYFMSCFVVSLRGGDGFMMDASGLRYHIGKVREVPLAHVIIPLVGMFKGLNGSGHHLQAIVNNTYSKLKVGWCLERLNN